VIGLANLADAGLDACTLNNALNVAQLVVLVALLRWVRQVPPAKPDRPPADDL
jgi:hypothetical protein